ncbi:MAG: hypothetical protein JSS02_12750 [Planctomycetes bacterium]|nr:hypothetical protein [Planctomycetota bacterium]
MGVVDEPPHDQAVEFVIGLEIDNSLKGIDETRRLGEIGFQRAVGIHVLCLMDSEQILIPIRTVSPVPEHAFGKCRRFHHPQRLLGHNQLAIQSTVIMP